MMDYCNHALSILLHDNSEIILQLFLPDKVDRSDFVSVIILYQTWSIGANTELVQFIKTLLSPEVELCLILSVLPQLWDGEEREYFTDLTLKIK